MVYNLCALAHLFRTIHVLEAESNLQLQLRQPVTIPSYPSIPPCYLSGTLVAPS